MTRPGSILIAGTHSGVGKSTIVTGLCRLLERRGFRVAPFKAENISLNSGVTPDGAEISRAQLRQAQAARATPEAAINPVLVKPKPGAISAVHVMGRLAFEIDARRYHEVRRELMHPVKRAFKDLAGRYDVIVCEGSGGAAEINVRDIANFALADALKLPVVLAGDIEQGGVFSSLVGTHALLSERGKELVGGFIINRVRPDGPPLTGGIDRLEQLTNKPVLGCLPRLPEELIDAEDGVGVGVACSRAASRSSLEIVVIALPWLCNSTDFDPLTGEDDVEVRLSDRIRDVERADLVVIPGTRATIEDLSWLRRNGLGEAVQRRAAAGGPVLGICGGYQMLGHSISDRVESGAGETDGLGILPIETEFHFEKTVALTEGSASLVPDAVISGYEIHHGRVRRRGADPLLEGLAGDEGCRQGSVVGTSLHGIFECDRFRHGFLAWLARTRNVRWSARAAGSFRERRERQIDALADQIEAHLDTERLLELIFSEPKTAAEARSEKRKLLLNLTQRHGLRSLR